MEHSVASMVSRTEVDRNIYTSQAVYEEELKRIFERGWVLVGVEASVPSPGDFSTHWMGDVPVIVARDDEGAVHVFENSCSHRGAKLALKAKGNCQGFTCIYHNWRFALNGDLKSVPMSAEFSTEIDKASRSLRKAKVGVFQGLVFASFNPDVVPIAEYLGELGENIADIIQGRKTILIGRHRFEIPCNWKIFWENGQDAYHVALLHKFATALGVLQQGENIAWENGHGVVRTPNKSVPPELLKMLAAKSSFKMQDLSMFRSDRDGGWNRVLGMFPNGLMLEQWDMLNVRQLVPRGPERVEIYTYALGFEGYTQEQIARYARAYTNFHGPAGFVGRDDVTACTAVQEARHRDEFSTSLMALGNIEAEGGSLNGEYTIRNFYKAYSALMNAGGS